MVETVTHRDGTVESWDHTAGYKRTAADGTELEERLLTPAEAERLTQFENAPAKAAEHSQLWQQLRAAYDQIATFNTAAANVTYPLSVGAQQALVTQVVDLGRVSRALLKLLDEKGLIT